MSCRTQLDFTTKEDAYVMLVVAGFAMWNMEQPSWPASSCARRCAGAG